MSLITLDRDIICEMSKYFGIYYGKCQNTEDDNSDSDDFEYEKRYDMWNLYASCKSFEWLKTIEFICMEDGVPIEIITRNINGKIQGMCYQCGNKGNLIGYYGYNDGITIKNHTLWYTDCHYHHRTINGKEYFEKCSRQWKKCEIPNCQTCRQLDELQNEIFKNDEIMANIIKNFRDYENLVILRHPRKLLDLEFNVCETQTADL